MKMSIQIDNNFLFEMPNTGNVDVDQRSAAKTVYGEDVQPAYSSHTHEGDVGRDIRSSADSFDETLQKKIAQDQDATRTEEAARSHNTEEARLKDQSQGHASENAEVGQKRSTANHVKQDIAKPPKERKSGETKHSTPDQIPGEAALGTMTSAEGPGVAKVRPMSLATGSSETLPEEDSEVLSSDVTPMHREAVPSTARSSQGISPAQGQDAAGVLKTISPSARVQESKANPQPVPENQQGKSVDQLTASAQNQQGTSVDQLTASAQNQQGKSTEQLTASAQNQQGKSVDQLTASAQNQQGKSVDQLPASPQNQQGKGTDQLTASPLENDPVTQSIGQKRQGVNTNHSRLEINSDVLQDAGQDSQGKTKDQANAGASSLSAEQRQQTARAVASGPNSDSHRFVKETTKSEPGKVPSGPMQSGVLASKAPAAVTSNDGQVTNPVDHIVSNNSQVSVFDNNVSNPADVKPSSLFDGAALLKGTSSSVSGQILESIHSSMQQGQNRLTIALNPPELGRVSVRFEEQDNQLIGVLEVSQKQTRAEIEQALPQLLQNLQDSGVQVKRLDVMLNDQQEHSHTKDQSWNDSSSPYSDEQSQQDRESRSGGVGYAHDGQGSETNRADFSEPGDDMLAGSNAINMLA